jgi:hypothetical protein
MKYYHMTAEPLIGIAATEAPGNAVQPPAGTSFNYK